MFWLRSLGLPLVLSASLALSACGGGGGSGSDTVVEDQGIVVSGSVGDGPVTGAEVAIRARNGRVLGTGLSDSGARYGIELALEPDDFPLSVIATGGIDLVTGRAPDVPLESLVVSAGQKVANLTPLTTIIARALQTRNRTITRALMRDMTRQAMADFGFGLESVADPLGARIDASHIPAVVASSETLGEALRRTLRELKRSGHTVEMGELVSALADDLSDGRLDGVGADATDGRFTATFRVASAGPLSELMVGRLHVDGADATSAMDAAVSAIAPTVTESVRDLRLTESLITQTRQAVSAATRVQGNADLNAFLEQLNGLEPGLTVEAAATRLTVETGATLTRAVELVVSGNETLIAQVNDGDGTGPVAPAPDEPAPGGGGASDPGNSAPVISGAPGTAIMENAVYRFTPDASDPDGDALSFTVVNCPAWAQFDSETGTLAGTPRYTDVGTTSGIVIRVSDGTLTTALQAFDLTVRDDGIGNGTAALSWTPPTTRTDGSALTDLAGFRIYYGPGSGNYSEMVEVGSGIASFVVEQLDKGQWYFAVTALDSQGLESQHSDEAGKYIDY